MINQIRTILIDDDPDCIAVAENILASNNNIKIIGKAQSAESGITLIKETQPDLVLLDVEMPGKSGFDVIAAFENYSFKVIFATGHDQYAIKAIKCSAVDYILKPICPEEMNAAILKVMTQINDRDNRITQLKKFRQTDNEFDRIIITSKKGFRTLMLEDIISIESKGSYALFYTASNHSHLCTKPLKYYEDLFPRDTFFRIHRSHIVNIDQIKRYDNQFGVVTLSNDKILEVAVRRRGQFSRLIRYKFNS